MKTNQAVPLSSVAIPWEVRECPKRNSTKMLAEALKKKGLIFNEVDTEPFKAQLRKAVFYAEWKGKFGDEAWTLLEKYVGKLT